MKFYSRKWVKPEDLNPNGSLFGGRLLDWIDEEAAIFAMCQLNNNRHIVTKYISEIDFKSSAYPGDIVELGTEVVDLGKTSITLKCVVRNKVNKEEIIHVDKIVFVNLNSVGVPTPHNVTGPIDPMK